MIVRGGLLRAQTVNYSLHLHTEITPLVCVFEYWKMLLKKVHKDYPKFLFLLRLSLYPVLLRSWVPLRRVEVPGSQCCTAGQQHTIAVVSQSHFFSGRVSKVADLLIRGGSLTSTTTTNRRIFHEPEPYSPCGKYPATSRVGAQRRSPAGDKSPTSMALLLGLLPYRKSVNPAACVSEKLNFDLTS